MKQRAIFQEIWRDSKFVELNKTAKLVMLYCLTNSNIRLIRAFRLTDREIMFDTGITAKELKVAKVALYSVGVVFLDDFCILKTNYGVFKYKGKHLKKAIDAQLSEIPEKVLEILKSDTLWIEYQESIDRVGDSDSDSDSDSYAIFLKFFNELTKRRFKTGNRKAKRQYTHLIKSGYKRIDFEKAILNAYSDPFHIESGCRYLTPEFITRADKFERFWAMSNVKVDARIKKISEKNMTKDEKEAYYEAQFEEYKKK